MWIAKQKQLSFLLSGLIAAMTQTSFAQQQQTIYQTLGTGIASAGILPNVQNIGQSFHLTSLFARNATGQTCAALAGTLALQGSFDNSAWTNLRVQQFTAVTGIFSASFSAQGAYPFIRVNVLGGLDTAQCVLDIAYSGNITGSTTTSSISSRLDNFTTVSGKLTGPGTGLTGPVCATNMYAMFYGGYFTNVGAAILGATAGLEGTVNNSPTGLTIRLEKLAVGANLVLPHGPRPYVVGLPNITQTIGYGLTAGTGDVIAYNLVFRCE